VNVFFIALLFLFLKLWNRVAEFFVGNSKISPYLKKLCPFIDVEILRVCSKNQQIPTFVLLLKKPIARGHMAKPNLP